MNLYDQLKSNLTPEVRHGTLRTADPPRRHDLLSVSRRQDTINEAL